MFDPDILQVKNLLPRQTHLNQELTMATVKAFRSYEPEKWKKMKDQYIKN